eukprot:Sspe_Gene.42463::Locus_20609_Transcript_1_1_Confidence_1.000_Length_1515::g.42463::m.42463
MSAPTVRKKKKRGRPPAKEVSHKRREAVKRPRETSPYSTNQSNDSLGLESSPPHPTSLCRSSSVSTAGSDDGVRTVAVCPQGHPLGRGGRGECYGRVTEGKCPAKGTVHCLEGCNFGLCSSCLHRDLVPSRCACHSRLLDSAVLKSSRTRVPRVCWVCSKVIGDGNGLLLGRLCRFALCYTCSLPSPPPPVPPPPKGYTLVAASRDDIPTILSTALRKVDEIVAVLAGGKKKALQERVRKALDCCYNERSFQSMVDRGVGRKRAWMVRKGKEVVAAAWCSVLKLGSVGVVENTTPIPMSRNPRHLTIDTVWVDPHHRCQGIAKLLLSTILHYAHSIGAAEVELEVLDSNHVARHLYQSVFHFSLNQRVCPLVPDWPESPWYLSLTRSLFRPTSPEPVGWG